MIAHADLEVIGSDEIRIKGTRVPLEVLIAAFQDGESMEDFVRRVRSVTLGQAYGLIAYYLANPSEVDAYVARAEAYRRESRQARSAEPAHPAVARLREILRSHRESSQQAGR